DKFYTDLQTFGSDDPSDGSNEFVALAPGHILGEYYTQLWAGVDPDTGEALWWTDGTMTATTTDKNEAQKAWMGKSSFPKYNVGLSNTFNYKNLSLSLLFTGQFDFLVHNGVHSYTIHDGRFPT